MSFTEKQIREYDDEEGYNQEIEDEIERRSSFLVSSKCCNAALNVVVLHKSYLESDAPKWIIKGRSDAKVNYCPFCGVKLGVIVPVIPPGPISECSDGGYHCDVCSQRLRHCRCFPPEAAWGVD